MSDLFKGIVAGGVATGVLSAVMLLVSYRAARLRLLLGSDVVVIGWFAALVTGRLPRWAAEFLSGYVSWQARLYGYLQLLTDVYPPFSFTTADYPVRVVLGPAGELKRLAVLFRFILLIPAMIVSTLVSYGWYLFSFITWLIVLFLGELLTASAMGASACE